MAQIQGLISSEVSVTFGKTREPDCLGARMLRQGAITSMPLTANAQITRQELQNTTKPWNFATAAAPKQRNLRRRDSGSPCNTPSEVA